MTPAEFRKWMQDKGHTPATLAEALDVKPRTIYRWLDGTTPIAHLTVLALRGLEMRGGSRGR